MEVIYLCDDAVGLGEAFTDTVVRSQALADGCRASAGKGKADAKAKIERAGEAVRQGTLSHRLTRLESLRDVLVKQDQTEHAKLVARDAAISAANVDGRPAGELMKEREQIVANRQRIAAETRTNEAETVAARKELENAVREAQLNEARSMVGDGGTLDAMMVDLLTKFLNKHAVDISYRASRRETARAACGQLQARPLFAAA